MQNVEINPNLAMSLTRQFGITIMNSEGEKIVQMLKFMHRQGFENGAAIERNACAELSDDIAHKWYDNTGVADEITKAIRARGEA